MKSQSSVAQTQALLFVVVNTHNLFSAQDSLPLTGMARGACISEASLDFCVREKEKKNYKKIISVLHKMSFCFGSPQYKSWHETLICCKALFHSLFA